MKFCRNCGEELAKEAKFCKHCGFDLTNKDQTKNNDPKREKEDHKEIYTKSTTSEKSGSTTTTKDLTEKAQSIHLSKKSKLLIAIAGALIIFLLIGFKVGQSMTSYEKKIEKFETAIIDGDAKKLAGLLTTENKNLTINADSVGGIITHYQEYPSEMNDLVRHLKAQGKEYEENPELTESDIYYDDYFPIDLVKNGKKLIYDNYEIQVGPVYFSISTNYEDTEITLDGEVIDTSTSENFSKEFGPYLPGTYTFGAKYSSEYVDLETETTHTHFNIGNVSEVNLYLEADDVYFESAYYDHQAIDTLKLYIDNEDTGINLMEQHKVGPLPTDGSLEISYEGEFPWGTMESEVFSLDSDYMEVSFLLTDELKETMQEKIIQYNKEYLEVYTTANDSLFTVASDDVIKEVMEDAEYNKARDREYIGTFIGVDFYEEAFNLSFDNDGSWYISVGTDTIFEENSFGFFSSSEPELTEKAMEYQLVYQAESNDWIIMNTRKGSYMTMETKIEHREEDPEKYTSVWAEADEEDENEDED